MSEELKRALKLQLWNISNELRGSMEANDFKAYILGFIFYKYLSMQMESFADSLLKDEEVKEYQNLTDEAYLNAIEKEALNELGYFLKPSELFTVMQKKGNKAEDNFILDDLKDVFQDIENSAKNTDAEDDFVGLFNDVRLDATRLGALPSERNELIAKVMSHLEKLDFELEGEGDLLGDAYEYLIGEFASTAGKSGGEFFTPSQVSKLSSKIVTFGKDRIKSVYDPTCGSGSLLLKVGKEVSNPQDVMYFGQEKGETTYNLARMNMIMHGIHYNKFDIKHADTLKKPMHLEHKFEAIVANPPFSLNWDANVIASQDDRFSQYGKLAPKTKADFAFIQHMIYQLDEKGTMTVIVPHGVLFRGSAEAHIRKYLIENRNYLDAVIGLPANIFYGTGIETALLVFKKCRENEDNILFIDASKEPNFEKKKNQNNLRDEDINRIVDAYGKRKNIDKYSYVAKLDEIAENDYNLNIPRYVDTFEEEETIDIKEVAVEIKTLEADMKSTDDEISKFCDELGIMSPFEGK